MALYTPFYNLPNLLVPILTPLFHNDYTVKKPEAGAIFDHKYFIGSLDVESLFTNIPLNKAINNCNSYRWKLSQNDLFCLIKLTT